jgi:putative protease
MKRPEILSPAGDLEKLAIAFEYGADAVYAAGEKFGLRSYAGNFTDEGLRQAVETTRKKNKKIYIAVNVFPHNDDMAEIKKHISYLKELKVDGIIVSDLGVFSVLRETAPEISAHISVQANNLNYKEVEMWGKLGASRVILARELTFSEIAEIKKRVPGIELEIFVHGAVCMSMSGRCLISNYLTGRDANRGECAQSCRWSYSLVEEKRPGEYLPVCEDDRGTYIFNSKDLCTIGRVPDMARAGIDSFKIEGRMKSTHYTAVTTAVYKKALDTFIKEPDKYVFDDKLYAELEKVSHRTYYQGHYFEKAAVNQDFSSSKYVSTRKFLGHALETSGKKIKMNVKNTFKTGDEVEIFTINAENIIAKVSAIRNDEGVEEIYAKQGREYSIEFDSPEKIPAFSMIRQKNAGR